MPILPRFKPLLIHSQEVANLHQVAFTSMPNRLSHFWQELRRRKVIRVITVYAAAAFVILQLIEILAPSLRLPEWTMNLVLVILIVGFIIAVILSWIYDIHPEGGIVKTDMATGALPENKPGSSHTWKMASYFSFVVIVGLILLNIIPRAGNKKVIDRSIAILPFKYLGEESNKQYLADGIMDEILLNLSRIESLRVLARTSVEQYRETEKTATEICQELGISYLLEGSFLKEDDMVRLIVQLIKPGKEGHVWAKNYDRSWEDIFEVQSEVARLVAGELQAIIAPEEQQRINNAPTSDLAAYEIFLKANARRKEFLANRDQSAFDAAVDLFSVVLEMDSTFAQAYTGLADVYATRYVHETYFDQNFLDTVLVLIDRALFFDEQLDEAYNLRGRYHRWNGRLEESLADFDRALEINPNYSDAFFNRGSLLIRGMKDYRGGLDNYQKALNLIFGEERSYVLGSLSSAYMEVGMIELAGKILEERLALDGDSVAWLGYRAWSEFCQENFEEAYHYQVKRASMRKVDLIAMDYLNCLPPAYRDAYYENILRWIKYYQERNILPFQYAHRIGYGFFQMGNTEEARRYFEMQIQYGEESIRLGRSLASAGYAQYDLAATYAFIGEKEKAYKYLSEFGNMDKYPLWWVTLFRNDPLFNGIRNEPEFQMIQHNVEAKYRAEHERVRQWLEGTGYL